MVAVISSNTRCDRREKIAAIDHHVDLIGAIARRAPVVERIAVPEELSRFLAVVGPSGSGKSSVVRAGVMPALRRGGLPGGEHWLIVELMPGAEPLEELEAALVARSRSIRRRLLDRAAGRRVRPAPRGPTSGCSAR